MCLNISAFAWQSTANGNGAGGGIAQAAAPVIFPVSAADNRPSEQKSNPVRFPDPGLETAVRDAIHKPSGDIYESDLAGLNSLDASFRFIEEITGLEYCRDLTSLNLNGNIITDIAALSNITGLTELSLGSNILLSDIEPLAGLTNLAALDLSDNSISDLQAISGLARLNALDLSWNPLEDISPLKNLTGLASLKLAHNQIADITPLAGLTALTSLDLSHNQCASIGALAGLVNLTNLSLQNNKIVNIDALSGLPSLAEVYLESNPLSQIALCTGISVLAARAVTVHSDGVCSTEGEGPGESVMYRFERIWPTLRQPWYFVPDSVAVGPGDLIYIADTLNHCIQKFNVDGVLLAKWGSSGTGDGQFSLDGPGSVAVGPDGSVYATDGTNNCIQKFTADGIFAGKWGTKGNGNGQLNGPRDVAIGSGGSVYISDTLNNRVQRFTADGVFVTAWGSQGGGNGQFNAPKGLAVGPDGAIYVNDTLNNRIQKFTEEGVYLTQWDSVTTGGYDFYNSLEDVTVGPDGTVYIVDTWSDTIHKYASNGSYAGELGGQTGLGDGQFMSPYGVAVTSDGLIYVADNWNSRIQKFTADGTFLEQWGSLGCKDGEFDSPGDVAIAPDGQVYVADEMNNRIQKFTANGVFQQKWGGLGNGDGQFIAPFGIAAASDGSIYAVDWRLKRVQKFTANGAFLLKWGSQGNGDGQFGGGDREGGPFGVAADSDGFVYIADTINNRIQKFTADGTFVLKWGSQGAANGQFDWPQSVAAGPGGTVFVVDTFNNRIQKFTANGAFLGTWGGQGFENGQFITPLDVAVGADGSVFVTDAGNNRIQQFTSDGAFVAAWGGIGYGCGQFNAPQGVAVGPDGTLYVSEYGANRIQKFKPVALKQNSKAIVVAGGGPFEGNNLWPATEGCANYAYRTLNAQGFTKPDICYLSSDTQLDLDGNGLPDDVSGDCTVENLHHALTQWIPERTNDLPTGNVVLYLVDHGGNGTFRMSSLETLSATDLAQWVNQAQASLESGKITIIYDACYSGSFVESLSAPGRIVITSAQTNQSAYFLCTGTISFSNFFWTQIFNGFSVQEAFNAAQQAISSTTMVLQAPLLSDLSGLAPIAYIGNGTAISSQRPAIGTVSVALTPGTNAGTVSADPVTGAEGVARVWAVIRPPDYTPSDPGNPVLNLPLAELAPVSGTSKWQGQFDGFCTPGEYRLTVYARDRAGNTSPPKTSAFTVSSPLHRRAIIVAAGSPGALLWSGVNNASVTAFNALKFQGYADEDIYFMSPETSVAHSCVRPSYSSLQYAVREWAAQTTQDLVIYLAGSIENGEFKLSETETLPAEDLDNWLNTLQETLPGKVVVICDACYSESFVTALRPPSGKERILIASAASDQCACFLSDGDVSFSKFFWTGILNGSNLKQSFLYAKRAIAFAGNRQNAGLDDDGNGVLNEPSDGQKAERFIMGAGIMLAGNNPMIGKIAAAQTLSGSPSAEIWVDQVTTTTGIEKVWAVITPPGYTPSGGLTGPMFPVIELFDLGQGIYRGSYDGFVHKGVYDIAVYAKDNEGNVSIPIETEVNQTVENSREGQQEGEGETVTPDTCEPDNTPAQASWIGIGATPQTHNFHRQSDEDWTCFFSPQDYIISMKTENLGADCDTVIDLYAGDGTTLLTSSGPASQNGGSSQLMYIVNTGGVFYLRLHQAVNTAFGTDMRYDLSVYLESGPCGPTSLISGTVKDAATGRGIPNAAIEIMNLGLNFRWSTDAQGEYLIPGILFGNYSLQARAEGYNTPSPQVAALECGQSGTVDFKLTPIASPEGEGEPPHEGEGDISQEGEAEGEIHFEGEIGSEGESEGEEPPPAGCSCAKADETFSDLKRYVGDLFLLWLGMAVLAAYDRRSRKP